MVMRNAWVYGALLVPILIIMLAAKFNLGITEQVDKLSVKGVEMIGKDAGPWLGYSCSNQTGNTSCMPIQPDKDGSSYVVLPTLILLMGIGAIGGYFLSKK